jgi:hypothetical protein
MQEGEIGEARSFTREEKAHHKAQQQVVAL